MGKLTLPEKLDRFPPVVVRLLARRTSGPRVFALTETEIVSRSGLSPGEVRLLSRQTSWENVPVGTMLAFCSGCGADLDDRNWLRKNTAYMASICGSPRYLRRSPDWQTIFEPLIHTWLRTEATKTA